MELSSELPGSQESTTSSLDNSSTSLQFPRPVADQRLTCWIQSTAAVAMSARSEAPSDEGNLSESTYEFIDTDEESRDDNATESVASTDFGRPDDVASLTDTEHSGDESGEEDGPDTSAIPGLEHNVEQAFSTPTIGRSSTVLIDDAEKSLVHSIEFEEPYSLAAETISVKHTVTDFNEEQTASTIEGMMLQSPPKRLAVTIRQTMTKQGLSTREPLRILYVGSHSAKQDIIHKIASSVTASVDAGNRGQQLRHSPQLYNVVPVSAFGSERTPEIELMHSSGYQINVEDCTSAQNLRYEDAPEKPDVIKLTLDDNFSYHSVPEGEGFIVEPHWELPHVAVFYCSDNDDSNSRRTTTITRKFVSRHKIPSIVISHRQLFDRGQCMSLDQHSIHMCLESRDPNGRGNIIHRRLPIDLASFLNIDARQMNRNLAYLTGLHETLEVPALVPATKKTVNSLANPADLEKTSYSISDSVSFIRNRNGAEWRAFLPVGLLLLSVFTAVLTGIPSYRFSSTPAISINSKTMSAVAISTSSTTSPTSVPSLIATSPSIAVKTSTRTITVTHAQSQGPNSLAVVPSMELGKLTQPSETSAKPVNKSSVCTAEILGDREILIRIPTATKLSWLTKEAISVNVTRGNVTVDTERAYSSDEGIVLSLLKKEAYGVLNIDIITTKKPRVNETFQVDFGTTFSQTWQHVINKLSFLFINEGTLVDAKTYEQVLKNTEHLVEEARVQSQSALAQIEVARKFALKHAASTTDRLTGIAKSMSLEAAKNSAILSKELGIQISEAEAKLSKNLPTLEQLREPLKTGLLKAQVRSKLMWLKLQGRDAEYSEYKRRAAEAIYVKMEEAKKSRRQQKNDLKKDLRAAKKCRTCKKAGKKNRG